MDVICKHCKQVLDKTLSQELSLSLNFYCQDWEIDQLLQICMHNVTFLIFAWMFKAKYLTKICPSQKG